MASWAAFMGNLHSFILSLMMNFLSHTLQIDPRSTPLFGKILVFALLKQSLQLRYAQKEHVLTPRFEQVRH
jgi:hypothetical protein